MNLPTNLDALSPDELRTLAAQLMAQVGEKDRSCGTGKPKIDQLTHELAIHKSLGSSAKRSEQLTSGTGESAGRSH
ncbi:transposase IS66 domain protein [Ralstonia pickettii]|nr:transposase IS66 domain protein [Ralstonia pickettii]